MVYTSIFILMVYLMRLVRIMRQLMVSVLQQEYVKTAVLKEE